MPLKVIFPILLLAAFGAQQVDLEPSLHIPELLFAVAAVWGIWTISYERLKPWVFLVASPVFGVVLFGVSIGLLAMGLGLVLFTLMHLPIAIGARKLLLGSVALLLLVSTSHWDNEAWNHAIPIVGGLFMLRSILYLYELQHEKSDEANWITRLTYFFLLPNIALPIFPIVDWKTFRTKSTLHPQPELIDRGVRWIANGLLHFIAYRVVYHYVLPTPSLVDTSAEVWLFIAANYLLILRLAGMFHLAAGILCLFGFDLPKTFDHYFFARNFNEVWQRINRYWRDFVMRTLYYPIYFKVKRFGKWQGMSLTLAIVFVLNWFLHGWQYWWLRGQFPLKIQDALFWGGFGIAVILNSLYLAKRPAAPSPNRHALQIAGMFWFMSLLWSVWISPELQDWIQIIQPLGKHPVSTIQTATIGFGLTWFMARIFLFVKQNKSKLLPYQWSSNWSAVTLTIIAIVCAVAPHKSTAIVWTSEPNVQDEQMAFEGYYEEIVPANGLLMEKRDLAKPENEDLCIHVGSVHKQFKPNLDTTSKKARLRTNSLGYRGPEYSEFPEENLFRIALLGGSIEVGGGVEEEETLSRLAEDKINERLSPAGCEIQIINCSVPASHEVAKKEQWHRVEADYHPHLVLWPLHAGTLERIATKNLRRVFPDSTAKRLYRKTMEQLASSSHPPKSIVQSYLSETVDLMTQMVDTSSAKLMLVNIPDHVTLKQAPDYTNAFFEVSRGLEFVDLTSSFRQHSPESELFLRHNDTHFSSLAHRLVGEELAEALWPLVLAHFKTSIEGTEFDRFANE